MKNKKKYPRKFWSQWEDFEIRSWSRNCSKWTIGDDIFRCPKCDGIPLDERVELNELQVQFRCAKGHDWIIDLSK